jgi:hypothetical protein
MRIFKVTVYDTEGIDWESIVVSAKDDVMARERGIRIWLKRANKAHPKRTTIMIARTGYP